MISNNRIEGRVIFPDGREKTVRIPETQVCVCEPETQRQQERIPDSVSELTRRDKQRRRSNRRRQKKRKGLFYFVSI